MFHIICLETGEPVLCSEGKPMVWADGRGAAQIALDYSACTGKKYQPRPVKNDDWKAREQGRFDNGQYIRLPWADADWWRGSVGEREHFAHVSTIKDGMVAFTEDAAKGAADRQTRVKPGAYLTRYYANKLDTFSIQALAREFAGKYEEHDLCFAKTPDEIERVYVNGPNSCMSAEGSDYDSPCHPARVYGAGDLAIAYLQDDDGEITARALCWPEKLVHGRIYGDEHRLDAALRTAGYTHRTSALRGAKLLRISCEEGLVAPYIDGCPGIEDCGDYLRIGGELPSDSTTGVIREESGEYCPCCGEYRDEEFYFIRDRDEAWCEGCTNEHAVHTEPRGDYYADEYVTMANGEYWTPEHFERNGGMCEATEENYHVDDLVYLESAGVTWSRSYFRDHGFICEACGNNFDNEERGARCDQCEGCSGEAPPRDARGRYKARQGRDEHSAQLELTDATPF